MRTETVFAPGVFFVYLSHMAGFHDLVSQMQNPPEDGLPATIYDDLIAEYNGTSQLVESAQAKMTEYDAKIQSYESEISRLKSMNYDLLMSSGAANSGDDDRNPPAEDGPRGIDSLFG